MPNKREYISPYGEFEMDEATGLPALPEGHFWRVTRPQGGYWQVQLRKRTWYGSRCVAGTASGPRCVAGTASGYEMTASNVKEQAGYVLKYEFEKEPVHERYLVGDYPPKTLKN